jgi:hypothetical protein
MSAAPPDARCTWEGEIKLDLTVTTADQAAIPIVLCNFCDDATSETSITGHNIRLADLAPSTADLAALARPITRADHTVMLDIGR